MRSHQCKDEGNPCLDSQELGEALDKLKEGLDEVLGRARHRLDDWRRAPVTQTTEITPDVSGALWELVRAMPGVIGSSLSGEPERVDRARSRLLQLDGRLRAAGVEVGQPLTGYADRLARLRVTKGATTEERDDRT